MPVESEDVDINTETERMQNESETKPDCKPKNPTGKDVRDDELRALKPKIK